MRWVILPLFLAVMAVGACAKDQQAAVQEKSEFAWVDFKQALGKAQASNKLILVDVYTDW